MSETRGLRVLVADDIETNRLVLAACLQGTPHTVGFAADGLSALAMVRGGGYDAVFLDVQMPGLDGLEVARQIRAWERATGTPPLELIAVTALAHDDEAIACLAAGCDAVLARPVERAALLAALPSGAPAAPGPDPELAPLVPAFLRHRRAELVGLEQALGEARLVVVARGAHGLRGAAGTFGFGPLARAADALERAAVAGDAAAARVALERVKDALAALG